MSAANHTPGPWTLTFDDDGLPLVWSSEREGAWAELVATVEAGDNGAITLLECHANGRLIAAAPELLERLHSAVEQLEALNGAYALNDGDTEATQVIAARAREVIAKAEGHR